MPPQVRGITISMPEAGISHRDRTGGEGCNRRSFICTQGFKKQQAGLWPNTGGLIPGIPPWGRQGCWWEPWSRTGFLEAWGGGTIYWVPLCVCVCLQCRRPRFDSWVRKLCWRRDRLPTPVFLDFPWGSAGKESTCNVGDLGSIPGLGRSPGEGKGYPL